MSSLTAFSRNDLVRFQQALDLPIEEVEDGSRLWLALFEVQERDRRLGLSKSIFILERLGLIENLQSQIDDLTVAEDYNATSRSVSVPGQYSESFGFGQTGGGQLKGKEQRQSQLIAEIKRELGWINSDRAAAFYGRITIG